MDFWPVLRFLAKRKNGCFSVFPVQTPFSVIQDYFLGDLDYLTEFRQNQVEIRGTFPSEVPTAKIGQNLAQRPKNGAQSGQTTTYRKTEVIQSYIRMWGQYGLF